ncbi:sigma-70 family RNA polymerase sigma factor [Oscillatoria sp. CS-180]|nr:sigma-70 family RNA polymerase sigma factor [Oscillatoria sp. CS-180]
MDGGDLSQDLNQQLKVLVSKACHSPVGSQERQMAFAEIVRLVMRSGKLWRESTAYYPDSLQEMWEYCFRYIDDPEKGYDPGVCTLTTWLDDCLKRTLRRYRDRKHRQQKRHMTAFISDEGQFIDPTEMLVSPADSHTAMRIWTHLIRWVQADPDEKLRNRKCMRYPKINAQILLLKRLPPNEQSWDAIAAEFSADKKYIAQWYSRYCNSFLREWGRAEGYLENVDD